VLRKYVGALLILAVIVETMTVVLVGALLPPDKPVQHLPDCAFDPNIGGADGDRHHDERAGGGHGERARRPCGGARS